MMGSRRVSFQLSVRITAATSRRDPSSSSDDDGVDVAAGGTSWHGGAAA